MVSLGTLKGSGTVSLALGFLPSFLFLFLETGFFFFFFFNYVALAGLKLSE